jgi:sulfur carrier protein
MKIKLNSEDYELLEGSTLLDLLVESKLEDKSGIAVALNQLVIPREDWSSREIKEGDNILIIRASQGG